MSSANSPSGGRPRTVAIVVGVVVVVAALLVILLVNRGDSEPAATPASSASAPAVPSPTPTPPSVLWAGQVCTDLDRVRTSVSSLGRNLDYDVTADA